MPNVATFVSAGDGAAIPAGVIGETATGTNAGTTLTSGASTYANTLTIPIPSAGVWRIDLRWEVNNSATGTTWTANQVSGSISSSSTSHDSPGNKLITTGMVPTSNAAYVGIGANCTRIVSTTNNSTNYYAVVGAAVFTGGAPVAYTTYLITRLA